MMKRTRILHTFSLLTPLAVFAQTTPSPDHDAAIELDSYAVTADVLERYGARDTSAAAKTVVPLSRLPQSVQIVTSALVDERRLLTLTDALFNVSGVADSGARRAFDNVTIRGFTSSANVFLDGLRVERGNFNVQQELLGLERIEVLKGPASVLFGQGALGGLISQVSKRPQAKPIRTLQAGVGAYDFYEAALDLGGPFAGNAGARYRINLVAREQGDLVDFNDKSRVYAASTVAWDLGSASTLTLIGNYTRDRHDASYVGLPVTGTVLPNVNGSVRRKLYVGEPGLDGLEVDRLQLGYELEHRFAGDWKLTQNLRYSDSDVVSTATFAGALQANQRLLNRSNAVFAQTEQAWVIDTRVSGTHASGGLKHNLLAGVDLTFQSIDQTFDFGAMPALDLFAPVYGAPTPTRTRFLNFEREDTLAGFYAQDIVEIGRWSLLAGARWDRNETDENNRSNGRVSKQTDNELTSRFGAIVEIAEGLSAYASFAQSFLPNFGAAVDGSRFEPETGTQYEAGLKSDALGGRLRSTFAIYELTRENAIISNLSNPGFSLAIGEQRSRGAELDVGMRVTRAWGVSSALSYTDAEITRDVPAQQGHRPVNVPRWLGNVWSTYEWTWTGGRSFTVGLGGRYVGQREGTLPNTYRLPSYITADAAFIYRTGRWSAQVNFYNLFDEEIYSSASPTGQRSVMIGDPRNARASVRWNF